MFKNLRIKSPSTPPVQLTAGHFRPDVARIILVLSEEWPDYDIVITRGCEAVPGGAPKSRHLISQAFDFRTRHLPERIDREALVNWVLKRLGPAYWGYFRRTDHAEWIHLQRNGRLEC